MRFLRRLKSICNKTTFFYGKTNGGDVTKLSQIHKDCQRKLANAMNNTHQDAENIIDISFDVFYSQGNPARQRTHTLPRAKNNPSPKINGDSAYMKSGYAGDQISYSDGTFTGGEVLGATMTGTYGVVGDSSYDEIAFEDIIKSANNNFNKEFGK